jgi:hypothetical protein
VPRRELEGDASAPHQITATWLTSLLRESGHLPCGKVRELSVEHWRDKTLSHLYRLHPTYSLPVDLPDRFVLKRSKPESQSSVARRRRWKEHEFYTALAPVMVRAPVPRHFVARLAPGARSAMLLMTDYSASHAKPPSPIRPAADALKGTVDCLVSIHAAWWNHPDLCAASLVRDDEWAQTKAEATRRTIARFLASHSDRLPAETRLALEAVGAVWPAHVRRSGALPLTVVHGDAHPWNFLTPLDPRREQTLLLDWEAWSIEPGPHDLASLIALHLPSKSRAALEGELLERYVNRLCALGVPDYGHAACRADYRRSVARRMLAPVGMWSRGSEERVWWPMLERITAAFYDLRCEELLAT